MNKKVPAWARELVRRLNAEPELRNRFSDDPEGVLREVGHAQVTPEEAERVRNAFTRHPLDRSAGEIGYVPVHGGDPGGDD